MKYLFVLLLVMLAHINTGAQDKCPGCGYKCVPLGGSIDPVTRKMVDSNFTKALQAVHQGKPCCAIDSSRLLHLLSQNISTGIPASQACFIAMVKFTCLNTLPKWAWPFTVNCIPGRTPPILGTELLGSAKRDIVSFSDIADPAAFKKNFSQPVFILDTLFMDLRNIAQPTDNISVIAQGQPSQLPLYQKNRHIFYIDKHLFQEADSIPVNADIHNKQFGEMDTKAVFYFANDADKILIRNIDNEFSDLSLNERIKVIAYTIKTLKQCNIDKRNLYNFLLRNK